MLHVRISTFRTRPKMNTMMIIVLTN